MRTSSPVHIVTDRQKCRFNESRFRLLQNTFFPSFWMKEIHQNFWELYSLNYFSCICFESLSNHRWIGSVEEGTINIWRTINEFEFISALIFRQKHSEARLLVFYTMSCQWQLQTLNPPKSVYTCWKVPPFHFLSPLKSGSTKAEFLIHSMRLVNFVNACVTVRKSFIRSIGMSQ